MNPGSGSTPLRRLTLTSTIVVATIALSACSGESRPNANASDGQVSGSASAIDNPAVSGQPLIAFGPYEADATVAASLSEFKIETRTAEVPAGKLFVTGTNMGEDTHELIITHAGAPDEEGAVAGAEDIAPGETKAVAAELAPGRYQFACYIKETEPDGTEEDHYQLGMVREFEVK